MTTEPSEHKHDWHLLSGKPWGYGGDGFYYRQAEWACECGKFKTHKQRAQADHYGHGPVESTAETVR